MKAFTRTVRIGVVALAAMAATLTTAHAQTPQTPIVLDAPVRR